MKTSCLKSVVKIEAAELDSEDLAAQWFGKAGQERGGDSPYHGGGDQGVGKPAVDHDISGEVEEVVREPTDRAQK